MSFKLLLLCYVLDWPFKSGELVFYHPLTLPELSPDDFQSQTLWELIFWCGSPGLWVPSVMGGGV